MLLVLRLAYSHHKMVSSLDKVDIEQKVCMIHDPLIDYVSRDYIRLMFILQSHLTDTKNIVTAFLPQRNQTSTRPPYYTTLGF